MPKSPMELITQARSVVATSSFTAEAFLSFSCDEVVERPLDATGPCAVGSADPLVEVRDRLDSGRVLLEFPRKVDSFGCEGVLKFASFSSQLAKTGTTTALTSAGSEASSFGLERASATKFAFPCTYLISVVYSAIHDNW